MASVISKECFRNSMPDTRTCKRLRLTRSSARMKMMCGALLAAQTAGSAKHATITEKILEYIATSHSGRTDVKSDWIFRAMKQKRRTLVIRTPKPLLSNSVSFESEKPYQHASESSCSETLALLNQWGKCVATRTELQHLIWAFSCALKGILSPNCVHLFLWERPNYR